jgi:hypothetical protein
VELGKPYVICINSREVVKPIDVAVGIGYWRKQKPLHRKVTGKQEAV